MSYEKKTKGKRENLTHRVLHYLTNNTSSECPEWRDVTLNFFYKLFEIMDENPGITYLVHKDDGMQIKYSGTPIVYLHFRQKHFLIHCKEDYLLVDKGIDIFKTSHAGSWPIMWKAVSAEEVDTFVNYLSEFPIVSLSEKKGASRTIPVWLQREVYERDGGKCVACNSTQDLHSDHILPFSKGGASDTTANIQLLCSKCNLEKSANFWPVRIAS